MRDEESLLPLSPELFAQIRAIQIRTQRLVTDVLAGEYTSAFRGLGMEFAEVREYQPGDDIRRIDWNVTARSGKPFIKQHKEERELSVLLMVDVSASGAFGSSNKLKREVAAEVAAVLALCAIKSNDKVGLIVFTDRVEHFVPPKKGRAHLWRVIRDILTFEPKRGGTSLTAAIDYAGRVQRRRAVVFLISDFLDHGYEMSLGILARRHDVTAVSITDPRELEVPRAGLLELEDLESGERVLLDTLDARVRSELACLGQARRLGLGRTLAAAGIGEIAVRTDTPYVDAIVRYFRAREHARGAREARCAARRRGQPGGSR